MPCPGAHRPNSPAQGSGADTTLRTGAEQCRTWTEGLWREKHQEQQGGRKSPCLPSPAHRSVPKARPLGLVSPKEPWGTQGSSQACAPILGPGQEHGKAEACSLEKCSLRQDA